MKKNNFVLNLKKKIEERGMSEAEFAKLISVDKRTLRSWLKGESSPRVPHLVLMAIVLNCSVHSLIFD